MDSIIMTRESADATCNNGKHFFINSEFCDRYNIDFDEWYAKTIKEAYRKTCESLLSMLDAVIREQVLARQLPMTFPHWQSDLRLSEIISI
jgi:hypothetical protein